MAEQMGAVHAQMSERIPLKQIADRQHWRDRRILALLKLKDDA